MAQRKPLFVLTEHCKSQLHCVTCRAKNGGRYWRSTLEQHYTLPNNVVDFDCPYGKSWIEDKSVIPQSSITSVNIEKEVIATNDNIKTTVKPLQRGERLTPVNSQNTQKKGCGCQRGS